MQIEQRGVLFSLPFFALFVAVDFMKYDAYIYYVPCTILFVNWFCAIFMLSIPFNVRAGTFCQFIDYYMRHTVRSTIAYN